MKRILLMSALMAAPILGLATPASANGCAGYVNLAVWGCAPWDNNPKRMPGAPGYAAPQAARPAAVARPVTAVPQPVLAQKPPAPPLLKKGAGVISPNGSNIVAQGGGNIVAQGGGNMRPH